MEKEVHQLKQEYTFLSKLIYQKKPYGNVHLLNKYKAEPLKKRNENKNTTSAPDMYCRNSKMSEKDKILSKTSEANSDKQVYPSACKTSMMEAHHSSVLPVENSQKRCSATDRQKNSECCAKVKAAHHGVKKQVAVSLESDIVDSLVSSSVAVQPTNRRDSVIMKPRPLNSRSNTVNRVTAAGEGIACGSSLQIRPLSEIGADVNLTASLVSDLDVSLNHYMHRLFAEKSKQYGASHLRSYYVAKELAKNCSMQPPHKKMKLGDDRSNELNIHSSKSDVIFSRSGNSDSTYPSKPHYAVTRYKLSKLAQVQHTLSKTRCTASSRGLLDSNHLRSSINSAPEVKSDTNIALEQAMMHRHSSTKTSHRSVCLSNKNTTTPSNCDTAINVSASSKTRTVSSGRNSSMRQYCFPTKCSIRKQTVLHSNSHQSAVAVSRYKLENRMTSANTMKPSYKPYRSGFDGKKYLVTKPVNRYRHKMLSRSSLLRYTRNHHHSLPQHYRGSQTTVSHLDGKPHQKAAGFVSKYALERLPVADRQEKKSIVNQALGRYVRNLSRHRYKFINAENKTRRDQQNQRRLSGASKKYCMSSGDRSTLYRQQKTSLSTPTSVYSNTARKYRYLRRKSAADERLSSLSNTSITKQAASRLIYKSRRRSIADVQSKRTTGRQYCIYFNRFGRCNRGDKCQFIHDPDKVSVCTRFLRGTCQVTNCPFLHRVSKDRMPVCSYFLRGVCIRSDCPYLHVNVGRRAEICLDFVKGRCELGAKCKKKHTTRCESFSRTGQCSAGTRCPVKHSHVAKQRKTSKVSASSTTGPNSNNDRSKPASLSRKKVSDKPVVIELSKQTAINEMKGCTSQEKLPSFISLEATDVPEDNSFDQSNSFSDGSSLFIHPRLDFD